MFARHFFLALAAASLIAGCGGGDEPASLSPQRIQQAAAQRADVHAASVTPAQAAEQLLNAAESAYPNYFPGHKTTASFGAFSFRYYPETGMYLGVAIVAGLGYTQNGIYVVGGPFGTLANPSYQGLVTAYLPGLVIDTGLNTGHTLQVQVTAAGISSPVITLTNVPAPTSQASFCDGLAADTTFTQIAANGGGTMTINSCSFNGTTGSIAATLTISVMTPAGPFNQTISYTITYTYT